MKLNDHYTSIYQELYSSAGLDIGAAFVACQNTYEEGKIKAAKVKYRFYLVRSSDSGVEVKDVIEATVGPGSFEGGKEQVNQKR